MAYYLMCYLTNKDAKKIPQNVFIHVRLPNTTVVSYYCSDLSKSNYDAIRLIVIQIGNTMQEEPCAKYSEEFFFKQKCKVCTSVIYMNCFITADYSNVIV